MELAKWDNSLAKVQSWHLSGTGALHYILYDIYKSRVMTDANNTAGGSEQSHRTGFAQGLRLRFRCECNYRNESARIPLPKEEHIR